MATKKQVKSAKKVSTTTKTISKAKRKKVTPKKVVSKTIKATALKTKAATKNTKSKIDYFKLPFEVYYSEYVPVTQIEFKSDVEVKKFKNIKAAYKQQGGCWGLLMECTENSGPELYCCITNNHDEAHPSWLHVLEENDISFNYGHYYKVVVENNTVQLVEFSQDELDEDSEQYISPSDMDYCCDGLFVYHLDQSSPDYLILDSRGSRVKVDLEGYLLDAEENRMKKRIFDPKTLDEDMLDKCQLREFDEAKEEWIKGIIKNQFPKEKNLKFLC